MRLFLLLLFLTGLASRAVPRGETIPLLSLPDLAGWTEKVFTTPTSYSIVSIAGRPALKASSDHSASALIRKVDIDLAQTPFLNWSWRVDEPLSGMVETSRDGDDYAARVYVIVDGGLWFWQTRAISYVWSGAMPRGSAWPNAYTANSMMVAVESGPARAGQWVDEKRNVLQDLQTLHGIHVTHINAVAIMTDTDNSQKSATAYYGDIFFSAR